MRCVERSLSDHVTASYESQMLRVSSIVPRLCSTILSLSHVMRVIRVVHVAQCGLFPFHFSTTHNMPKLARDLERGTMQNLGGASCKGHCEGGPTTNSWFIRTPRWDTNPPPLVPFVTNLWFLEDGPTHQRSGEDLNPVVAAYRDFSRAVDGAS